MGSQRLAPCLKTVLSPIKPELGRMEAKHAPPTNWAVNVFLSRLVGGFAVAGEALVPPDR